ncbi:hypothetical protein PFISCL1PPCAC_1089, partial [Pristionchus fissidentatus]
QSDLIVGIAMIIVPLLCATAYSFILTAIYRDKELFKMTSYRFMFLLGCFDVTQCLPHLVTGVFTLCQSTGEYWMAKVMGVFATPFYIGYCMMTIILSVQRFVQILSPSWEQRVFNPRAVYIWIAGALSIVLSFIIALASPWASIMYLPRARFSTARRYSAEGKILIQALTVTVYCSILNILWHNFEKILPVNLWTYCALNFMWILNSGVYPAVYLAVNR